MKHFFVCIFWTILFLSEGCLSIVKQPGTQTSIPTGGNTLLTITPTTLSPPETVTLTALPILSLEDARKKLFELLQNNGGCDLPCLWGYTPGITNEKEISNFFNQFVDKETSNMSVSKVKSNDRSSVSFFVPYLDTNLNAGIASYINGNKIEVLSMDAFSQPQWHPDYAALVNYYMLPQILTNYGRPSQALILSYRNDRQRPDVTSFPFFLVLLYPDRGFYLEYETSRETRGDNFVGCPSQAFVSINVWIPGNDRLYNNIIKRTFNGGDLNWYKSILDAISMTTDEFYQTFMNPDNTSCLETPIEIWPNP